MLLDNIDLFISHICWQRIRSTVDEKEQKQLLMDLDVVMRSNECPYIVKFYGALFKEVSHFFSKGFITRSTIGGPVHIQPAQVSHLY